MRPENHRAIARSPDVAAEKPASDRSIHRGRRPEKGSARHGSSATAAQLWLSISMAWCRFQLRLAPGDLPSFPVDRPRTNLLRRVAGGLLTVADSTVLYK